jgi:hypothetical protein
MTLWFGSYVDLEPDHGYFYLCPSCYEARIAENLEEVQETLARLHPSTAALWDRESEEETDSPLEEEASEADPAEEADRAAGAGRPTETDPASGEGSGSA